MRCRSRPRAIDAERYARCDRDAVGDPLAVDPAVVDPCAVELTAVGHGDVESHPAGTDGIARHGG